MDLGGDQNGVYHAAFNIQSEMQSRRSLRLEACMHRKLGHGSSLGHAAMPKGPDVRQNTSQVHIYTPNEICTTALCQGQAPGQISDESHGMRVGLPKGDQPATDLSAI